MVHVEDIEKLQITLNTLKTSRSIMKTCKISQIFSRHLKSEINFQKVLKLGKYIVDTDRELQMQW
jgi:hypothetical protein